MDTNLQPGQVECATCHHIWFIRRSGGAKRCPRCQAKREEVKNVTR